LGPASDQIELTVFGPGYGECCVAHLGDDHWIVIDSCINSETKKPAAIDYLNSLGVDFSNVRFIVATHWHDDHVRGMAAQVEAFKQARFCSSSALTRSEFLATVVAYEERHNIAGGSGVSELSRVLEILRLRSGSTSPVRAAPGRSILSLPASGALPERVVRTLSPSDKQFDMFLAQMGTLMPKALKTKTRMPDQSPNDISIAIHITIGDQAFLLGADLEECGDAELGWSAILADAERPKTQAQVFKIPHHGSENGHCEGVWTQMLVKNPISIVTPWNRNKGLPTPTDVQRITALTHAAFCTSSSNGQRPKRTYSVEKQIRETVGHIRAAQQKTGWIRVRNGGVQSPSIWSIDCSDQAISLKDWQPREDAP
jgi:hypothetical protein